LVTFGTPCAHATSFTAYAEREQHDDTIILGQAANEKRRNSDVLYTNLYHHLIEIAE
jgi:hypothetical protein